MQPAGRHRAAFPARCGLWLSLRQLAAGAAADATTLKMWENPRAASFPRARLRRRPPFELLRVPGPLIGGGRNCRSIHCAASPVLTRRTVEKAHGRIVQLICVPRRPAWGFLASSDVRVLAITHSAKIGQVCAVAAPVSRVGPARQGSFGKFQAGQLLARIVMPHALENVQGPLCSFCRGV